MRNAVLLLTVFLLTSCGGDRTPAPPVAGDINQHLNVDLNQFYLNQLDQHQFLLLGEGKHNDHAADQAIIDLVSYWLDAVEKQEPVPDKLTLIIEYSESFGQQLLEFFETDDVTHLGIEIQGRTLNTLEFFYDLKDVWQRANQMKDSFDLDFAILCPEDDVPFDMSLAEQARIAQTERENNTTDNIVIYNEDNPGRKYIALYGGGHLVEKDPPEYPTTPWGVQIREEGYDTYTITLNHFFDPMPYEIDYPEIASDFVVTDSTLKRFFPKLAFVANADAFYQEPYFQAVTLKDIPSSLVVRKALEYARRSPRFIPALVSLWFRYTGNDISGNGDPLQYVADNVDTLNTIAAIEDLSLFSNVLHGLTARGASRQQIDKAMFDLTCFGNVLSRKPFRLDPEKSSTELWLTIVQKYAKEIKTQLYTSLLYYGNPTEKSEALAKLADLTGQDFATPKQWLAYSRQLWNSI